MLGKKKKKMLKGGCLVSARKQIVSLISRSRQVGGQGESCGVIEQAGRELYV
jgi:hypothetical protein